jgi:hypothetical protein
LKLHKEVTFEFVQRLLSEKILEERLRHPQGADNISTPTGRPRFDAWYTKRWLIRKPTAQIRRRTALHQRLPASAARFFCRFRGRRLGINRARHPHQLFDAIRKWCAQ